MLTPNDSVTNHTIMPVTNRTIMRINPQCLSNGILRRGQPLYVRPEADPAPDEQNEKPAEQEPAKQKAARRPPRRRGVLPRMDELDLPVLTEEDLRNWGGKG